ncbi:phospholipase D-like domain-containing protein [Nonomuraea jabiensis]|uniref:phospholipase D-like domain-containing protein n=1 Tax=Nonomuraea jabiensis TaxID=882448 RepID=UPI003D7338E2
MVARAGRLRGGRAASGRDEEPALIGRPTGHPVARRLPGAPATPAASACADAPVPARVTTTAVFNDPAGGDPAALVRTLCGLVRQTPAGARIQVAHFVMSGAAGTEFADELIKAHQRDVDVQVILDGDTRGGAVAAKLSAALGTDTAAGSWTHVCSGPLSGGTAACIGNAVVLPGNRRLYDAYAGHFGDLAAERKNLDYYRVVQTGGPGGSVRAAFFPKADGDPIVDELGKVSCQGGTTIRVGMSEWDTFRIAIPAKLRDLAARGCTVRIVYGIMSDEVKRLLLAEPRVELRTLGDGGALPGRLHSKYLLIEGSYGGDRDAHWVITGSHNYIETSLRRNDETLLRLNDKSIYRQYVANFERMRAVAPLAG